MRKSKWDKIVIKEFLIEEYTIKEKNIKQISIKVGCSCTFIRNRLLEYSIKIRTIKEALKLKETKLKQIKAAKNRLPFSEKTKQKLKITQGGKNNGRYIDGRRSKIYYCKEKNCKNKISYNNWLSGNKNCRGCSRIKENNPNYINGEGKFPYSIEFNFKFKEKVRSRDNYTCQICGMSEEEHLIVYGVNLSVHHIDYDKKNTIEENTISLCIPCHLRTNYNRKYWIEYFQEKFSLLINYK